MNYIQAYHQQLLSIVYVEDKPAYIKALNDSREDNNPNIFSDFLCSQHIKYLSGEIEKYRKGLEGISIKL